MISAYLMFLAWGIEAAFGWPSWLFRAIRHPVVWFGALISNMDGMLNRPNWSKGVRYASGMVVTCSLIFCVLGLSILVSDAVSKTPWGFVIEAALASSLIASRSLHAHVAAVVGPLSCGKLDEARDAVSMIVGRDPSKLDEAGISRASIESLAENASDGVIAPLFWGVLFGLPGIATYKAINTLDSMIGHRSDRYAAFGGFAARLDDVANFLPARLTGVLLALASTRPSTFSIMLRDARRHRSPNAGWCEAAMAGALDIRLSGPRIYGERTTLEPWLNADAPDPNVHHVKSALALYRRTMGLTGLLLAGVCIGIWMR